MGIGCGKMPVEASTKTQRPPAEASGLSVAIFRSLMQLMRKLPGVHSLLTAASELAWPPATALVLEGQKAGRDKV